MRNALAASSASGEHVYGWRARVCRLARCWATHQCPQPDQITAMTATLWKVVDASAQMPAIGTWQSTGTCVTDNPMAAQLEARRSAASDACA